MIRTANYATYNGPGRYDSLKMSVKSIIDQVDAVNIYHNGTPTDELNDWPDLHFDQLSKVRIHIGVDLTDNAKFVFLVPSAFPEIYLSCDDDIIYPPDYGDKMEQGIHKHGCIVTYHGRVLVGDNKYYKGKHILFHYKRNQPHDVVIDVPGTGVMGFRTDYFCPWQIAHSDYKKMSDLVFAYEARKAGKKIVGLSHKREWFKGMGLDGIWHEFNSGSKSEVKQVELLNKILEL